MMKFFNQNLLFIFIVIANTVLVGCSSNQKVDESEEKSKSSGSVNETYTPPSDSKSSANSPVEVPTKATPKAALDALSASVKTGDSEATQKMASNILAQNSNDPRALSALGIVNAQKNRWLAAIYFFKRSLTINPNSAETHTNLGLVYLQQKETKDAMKAFKKAIELGAIDGLAATNLGMIYAREGDYFKAMPHLDKAIKSGVKDGRVYNSFGVSLAANGKYEEAKEIYQQAIKSGQGAREAHFNLAILLIDHLNQPQPGLDEISRLRSMGLGEGMSNRINNLEIKAKAALK